MRAVALTLLACAAAVPLPRAQRHAQGQEYRDGVDGSPLCGGNAKTDSCRVRIDCEVRQLAWDFALARLGDTCLPLRPIHDALGLEGCPPGSSDLRGRRRRRGRSDDEQTHLAECRAARDWTAFQHQADAGGARGVHYFVVVSPESAPQAEGLAEGLGRTAEERWQRWLAVVRKNESEVGVYDSVHAALSAARKTDAGARKEVVLRGGLHTLGHDGALHLGVADSHMSIVAFPGETPVLSGGVRVHPSWVPWKCPHEAVGRAESSVHADSVSGHCWRAHVKPQLPAASPHVFEQDFVFNQLFLPATGGTSNDRRREKGAGGSSSSFSVRGVRARHPNADPEKSGLHTSPSGYMPRAAARWAPEMHAPPASEVRRTGLRPGLFPDFQTGVGGPAEAFDPPVSYWATAKPPGGGGTTFTRLSGLTSDPSLWPMGALPARAGGGDLGAEMGGDGEDGSWEGGFAHVFHSEYWGNWQFRLNASSSPGEGRLLWHEGGWQEARGSGGMGGAEWYVENVKGLLDTPNEWYYSASSGWLYMMTPPGSPPPETVVASGLATVLVVAKASNILLRGITVMHACSTFDRPYAAPNGGDWSFYPGAALVLNNSDAVTIDGCVFDANGGNDVLVQGRARGVRVTRSEFTRNGDSNIVVSGSALWHDGTAAACPVGLEVSQNLAHDMGVWGKQAGFVYQALGAKTNITANVAFNGPRAAVSFTDGFGGGHRVSNNLFFSFVRETSDHGLVNTWDRQPYVTTMRDGKTPSAIPADSLISRNLLINGYRAVWPVDHDDGSGYYTQSDNVLVYGGFKSFLGANKTAAGNLYFLPDFYPKQFGSDYCASVWAPDDGRESWVNNTCVKLTRTPVYGGEVACNGPTPAVTRTGGNAVYLAASASEVEAAPFVVCGQEEMSLARLQAMGYDLGSRAAPSPSLSTIMSWARRLLNLSPLSSSPTVKS